MKKRKSLLRSDSFQTLLTSLLCIILGVAIGYVVLLIINPAGAWKSMSALLKNFFHYPAGKLRMKYFGQTLVRTAPLLMCALSILFAYKVGMFNIGAAGQYVAGACVGLYAAIAWQLRGTCACCWLLLPARSSVPFPVRCVPTAMSTLSSPASCSTGSPCI